MPENGEISGFVKIFYGILIALVVGAGLYGIVSVLVAQNGFFDTALTDILQKILNEILVEI